MNKLLTDVKLIQRICRGDNEAMDFLANHWAHYCHEIDDIIDGERRQPLEILLTFGRAIELYTHPFFVKHGAALRQVARNVTLMYAQTVSWEKKEEAEQWKSVWADHHRHCSIEMVAAVATICGGLAHAAAVVPELRVMSYQEHHKEGKPI
jgi:hypothetical protein